MSQKQDEIIKVLGIAVLALIVFALLGNLFGGGQAGMGYGYGYGHGMGGGSGTANVNVLLASVFGLAVKLLWFVFVISLVVGLVLYIRKLLPEGTQINLGFFNDAGHVCPSCQTKIRQGYKFCPGCGERRNANEQ